jgi:hypothetical protein
MKLSTISLASIYIILINLSICTAVHDSMNLLLQPATRQCFFEDFDKNTPSRTIEAFVQTGGNINILLTIHGPLELSEIRSNSFEDPIVEEVVDAIKEINSDSLTFTMDFKPKKSGTYGFCLDNRKSYFQAKVVQLDVRLSSRPEPIALKLGGEPVNEEDGILRAKESISSIRKGLVKIQLQQQRDRHRLAIHSEINLSSHNKVLASSFVETSCFVIVAFFQIFFVRRWFASKVNVNGGRQRA